MNVDRKIYSPNELRVKAKDLLQFYEWKDVSDMLNQAADDMDRMDFIDGSTDEGTITFGFRDEEGVFLKAVSEDGTKTVVKGMNDIRRAIDKAMS